MSVGDPSARRRFASAGGAGLRLTPSDRDALLERLARGRAAVGVIGLGYVGLPLAITLAEAGFTVLGFDVDDAKVRTITAGDSYIRSVSRERIEAAVEDGKLAATADLSRLGEPDAILICVPTPLGSERRPDLGFVVDSVRSVARTLRAGQLVVLESTTYPGTTSEVVRPILEEGGMVAGEDFFLAYSPERENPGGGAFTTSKIPKVVGGVDEASGDVAEALYSVIVPEVVRVASDRIAEASKLTENIFRAVNIALVNELKMIFDRMDLDIWSVLDAAATKPFGFMRFNPGPGLGGHCIPIDPFYLSFKARQLGAETRFIELAGEINTTMPAYVVEKARIGLAAVGKEISECRALILGLAYKKNVDDPRESPAFDILDRLLAAGADVSYYDPYISRLPGMRSWPDLPALASVVLTEEVLLSMDVVLVVTDHDDVDYDLVWSHSDLIVDSRGVFKSDDEKLIRA